MNKCVEVWGLKQYSHRNRMLSFCSIVTRCHKPKVEIKLYSFSQESSLPAASTMTFCSCLATCGTNHAIFNLSSQLIHGLPRGYPMVIIIHIPMVKPQVTGIAASNPHFNLSKPQVRRCSIHLRGFTGLEKYRNGRGC